jgi:diguanylate cyclase (GGDEF)-like protein
VLLYRAAGIHYIGEDLRPPIFRFFEEETAVAIRMPEIKLLTLAICLLLGGNAVLALDAGRTLTQYGLRRFHLEQGLPQSSVQCILQSADGYLWVGTQDGLARFNGESFHTFPERSYSITCMVEDGEGRLLLGTESNGVLLFDQGSFTPLGGSQPFNSRVFDLSYSALQGALWVATAEGLYCYTKHWQKQSAPEMEGEQVYAVLADSLGRVWAGIGSKGLLCLQEGHVTLFTRQHGLQASVVVRLYEDFDGIIWIGTLKGLNAFRNGRMENHPLRIDSDFGLGTFLIDRDANIWTSSYLEGLSRHSEGASVTHAELANIPLQSILALYEDREGTLWIGTDGEGLLQLRDTLFIPVSEPEGLSNRMVFPLLEDGEGRLWAGMESGVLDCLTGRDIRSYQLADLFITSLALDRQGRVLVGADTGLYRVEAEKIQPYPGAAEVANETIWALLCDSRDTLWLGTTSSGLIRKDELGWTRFPEPEGVARKAINYLFESRAGELWIATDGNGLLRLHEGEFTRFGSREGFSHLVLTSILEDEQGALWITSHGGGLFRFKNGSARAFTMADGLPSNLYYQILADDSGHFWLSSTRGIVRLAREGLNAFAAGRQGSLAVNVFGQQDGLRSIECNGGVQACALVRADGTLWFSTLQGLAAVDPLALDQGSVPPSIAIEKVLLDGSEHAAGNQIPLQASGVIGKVEIQYSGLYFSRPGSLAYEFLLEGLDLDWVEAGQRKTAVYNQIGPGKYRFKVRAVTPEGLASPLPAQLEFIVQPHFHQTRSFFLLLTLVVATLVYSAFRLRFRSLETRENQLNLLVEERTRELQTTADALMIANEKLERLSNTDLLLGIANRRLFERVMEEEWRRGLRYDRPMSVIMVDVDHFKLFNDAVGHLAADEALIQVARTMQQTLNRPGDLLARYGGEELVIFLPETPLEGALLVAERLRAAVTTLAIAHPGLPEGGLLTVSLGVAVREEGMNSWKDLVEQADRALYQSKQRGRNCATAARGS